MSAPDVIAIPPVTRGRASVSLFGLALSTSVGYLLYEMFFTHLHPNILTFVMFLPLWVISILGLYGWRAVRSRPSRLHLYAIVLAFLQLTYWYCFWISISRLGASIAIAFIALTIFFAPLASHWHTRNTIREPASFIVTGLALCVGVFFVDLHLTYCEFSYNNIIQKLRNIEKIPVILILGCVAAESVQELVKDFMGDEVRGGHLTIDHLTPPDEPPAGGVELEINMTSAINALQMTVCVIVAGIGLLFVDANEFHAVSHILEPKHLTVLSIYAGLLFTLALCGHMFKWIVIDPLRYYRRLAPHTIPIFFAIRPVLLYLLSLLGVWIVRTLFENLGNRELCDNHQCILNVGKLLSLTAKIDLDDLPFSYAIGWIILGAAFVWNFRHLWRNGFAIPARTEP